MKKSAIALLVSGISSLALFGMTSASWAQDIGSMEDLFPAMPCHDGWAACLVDGDEVSPDAVRDSAGRPLPSDMRVGWFDLQATTAFDPFHGLSDYTGELPTVSSSGAVDALLDGEDPVVDAEPDAEEDTAEPDAAVEAGAVGGGFDEAAERAQMERLERDRLAAQQEAERLEEQRIQNEAAAKAAAQRAASAKDDAGRQEAQREADRLAAEAKRAAEQRAAAERELAAREAASREAAAQAERDAAARALAAEQAASDAAAKQAADREAAEQGGDAVAMVDGDAAQKDAPGSASCDNLVQLEPAALMGKLSEGQAACLEKKVAGSGSQTSKDKISRVLLANAEASGNKKEWERIMRRHLEEIDRSDPNLCFKYALHLSRGGVGPAWGVIKWSDYALENKTMWSGTTYKTRVYSLYQLKAEAATKLWGDANSKLVEAGGGNREELAANEEKLRGMAKDFSREWLDYARASGQDTKKPMSLCVSAAGSKKYCEGG